MCGIAGGSGLKEQQARAMQRAMTHRGPDGCGLQRVAVPGEGLADEVWLAHTRLAVIDLSEAAAQPMHDPATGNWIVFNGEVYNFRRLRSDLEALGTGFASASDTEVLLKAYGRWGPACLQRLEGMFAFAIWDSARRRLFLARDRIGIKPLYYHHDGQSGRILFASELRAVLAGSETNARLSPDAVDSYLQTGSVEEPLTMVEGVQALLPGHHLTWEAGRVTLAEYWDLSASLASSGNDRGHARRDHEQQRDLSALLSDVVRQHTVADVPVSVYLSGGIDSSALVSLLSQGPGSPPHTFSVVFEEPGFDESPYSQAVAREFGTSHHEVRISSRDILDTMDAALAAYDQPSVDGVNSWVIGRAVAEAGFKVALSGLGADEVFGGYVNARRVPRLERVEGWLRRTPLPVRRCVATAVASAGGNRQSGRRRLAEWVSCSNGEGGWPHPYFLTRALFSQAEARSMLRDGGRRPSSGALDASPAMQRRRALLDRAAGADPVNRYLYLETRSYLVNTLLRDADVMSMTHGVEVRVPYLDHRLVERMASVPGAEKLQGPRNKELLLRSLERPLPPAVVDRPKRGFTFPWDSWLHGPLGGRVQAALWEPSPLLTDVIDGAALRRLWSEFEQGRHTWSRVWAPYVLNSWVDRVLGASSCV